MRVLSENDAKCLVGGSTVTDTAACATFAIESTVVIAIGFMAFGVGVGIGLIALGVAGFLAAVSPCC
jgi:hypothetical protein